jgi:hypothetical protein
VHHLKSDIIDEYVKTLAGIDAHVSICLACATALSERASAAYRWERRGLLGRLVRVESRDSVVAPVSGELKTEAAAAA